MANTIIAALDEQFKNECKVIDLKYEYSGYTGTERFAVITELTAKEILAKYPEQIKPYIPFMILSPAFGEVRDEYRRNEKKHSARATRSVDAFSYDDEVMAAFHPELIGETLEQEYFNTKYLWEAIQALEEKQRQRIILYFFAGLTEREIAEIYECSSAAIHYSIELAIKNLKKLFQAT